MALFGQPVQALHPHGPLMEGVGLNITVMSYAGSIDVGVSKRSVFACRWPQLPDDILLQIAVCLSLRWVPEKRTWGGYLFVIEPVDGIARYSR